MFVLAAILGGALTLGAYKVLENKGTFSNTQKINARLAGYDIKNVTIPTFDFADVSEIVTPTVVHIMTTTQPKNDQSSQKQINPFDFFGQGFDFQIPQQGPQEASGSGVIISSDGYIVTNNHVIKGADDIEVVLYNKKQYKADVIGTDPSTDIALLKIKEEGLEPVKIGNSDEVRIGEWVLAVGNPFNLTSTVTAGIVSAKGRNINLLGGNTAIESFIQTDAAVNPGNSGGALVNSKGELVGINTAIASQTGQYAGYSFAVPSNIMKKVIDDLTEFGEVQRGFIGVQIREIDAKLATEKGLDKVEGVYVEAVTDGGAADDAGIKKGDVILKVDGKEANSVSTLQENVGRHRPGDAVLLNIRRDGKDKEVSVTLKNKDNKVAAVTSETSEIKKTLGATFEAPSKELMDKLKIKNGIKISALDKGVLKEAGVPIGYIITSIDKVNIYSSNDIYRLLQNKKGGVLLEGYLITGVKKSYALELN